MHSYYNEGMRGKMDVSLHMDKSPHAFLKNRILSLLPLIGLK